MFTDIESIAETASPLGTLTLTRRSIPGTRDAVYEIKLNGYLLMSSQVYASERALATLALKAFDGCPSDVLVGGLGIGHTAQAALEFPNVQSVTVAEYVPAIVEWHRQGLISPGRALADDPRCRLLNADFFALMGSPGHGASTPASDRSYDLILLDIDHSPYSLLHGAHSTFYEIEGLKRMARYLNPGGVFGLWAFDPNCRTYADTLGVVFSEVCTHPVTYWDAVQNKEATDLIFVAHL